MSLAESGHSTGDVSLAALLAGDDPRARDPGLARHARDGYGYLTMAEQHAVSRMTLTLVLEAVPDRVERDAETGHFFAINDDLHTIAEGDTQAEANANFHEALVGLVDYCLESGLPLPKALVEHRTVATA
jgi:predicted RNase H-like HicB family nuclease